MEGKGPKDPPRKGGEILLGWLSLGSLVALAPQGCFAVSMAPLVMVRRNSGIYKRDLFVF